MSIEKHPVIPYIGNSAWSLISSKFTPFGLETLAKVVKFVEEDCMPAESTFHDQVSNEPSLRWKSYPSVIEELKQKARSLGLWNLFLSKAHYPDVGVPLTNLEYAVMAEIFGRCFIASEACNCSAPDTGNMEVLARYGTEQQKKKWLVPLLEGKTRSSFSMTEKGVASSDATNIQTSITLEGNEIVISGRKWWISGAGDPRNAVHLVMGKSDTSASKHQQQSIVIVPSNAPGVKLIRPMTVFGYDHAPGGHFEIVYDRVRVPLENLIGGWGRGFEIIQGRLGPGRIHHCMRSIGVASRALELMLIRVTEPKKIMFGKMLKEHGTVIEGIAKSRMEIDQARLLVLSAALQIDLVRAKGAMKDIGMAKAVVPTVVGKVIDRAMQVHGAEGISQDTPLAGRWAGIRTLRYADGPDEVHLQQIGLQELKNAPKLHESQRLLESREQNIRKSQGLKPLH
ncbi:acyl-CoA dehydrogenase [Meredithblackwellia eburnea MCA 4105]